MLTPSVVKFSHVFNHHQHEVCKGESDSHIHTLDIDCDFYKFKLNTPYTFLDVAFETIMFQDNHQVIVSQYDFVNDYQRLHFSLRGPPQFV